MSILDVLNEWSPIATAEQLRAMGLCEDCGGKGWYIGDCHPQEECGRCCGTGRAMPLSVALDMKLAIHNARYQLPEVLILPAPPKETE